MIDFAGQFGRVVYAELECPRGSLRQHVAVKTMKCMCICVASCSTAATRLLQKGWDAEVRVTVLSSLQWFDSIDNEQANTPACGSQTDKQTDRHETIAYIPVLCLIGWIDVSDLWRYMLFLIFVTPEFTNSVAPCEQLNQICQRLWPVGEWNKNRKKIIIKGCVSRICREPRCHGYRIWHLDFREVNDIHVTG